MTLVEFDLSGEEKDVYKITNKATGKVVVTDRIFFDGEKYFYKLNGKKLWLHSGIYKFKRMRKDEFEALKAKRRKRLEGLL